MSIAALRGSGGTGSGMAIGDPVSGGTSQSVLYIDSTGDLAQDNPTFIYNDVAPSLGVVEGAIYSGSLSAENAAGTQATYLFRKGGFSGTIGGMWVLDFEVLFTTVLVAGFAPATTTWSFGPNHTQTTTTSEFSTDVTVPDEAYGVGWNGSLEVPTKNAIYDKIEGTTLDEIPLAAASVDFNSQQATNFRVENRTSDPGLPAVGQIWLRTDL